MEHGCDHPHILLLKIVTNQPLRQILAGHLHARLFLYDLRQLPDCHVIAF